MEYGSDYAWIGLILVIAGIGAAVYFFRANIKAKAEKERDRLRDEYKQ